MELTKRLSWRTKADQFYQSAGCGQTHIIKFMGICEGCGHSVYSHGCAGSQPCGDVVECSPDPRGAIPPAHCMNLYRASEYGLTGRNIVTCYDCSQNGDKYRGIIAAAKSTGTWIDGIKSLHIEGRRWFQCSAGNTYHSVNIFLNGQHVWYSGRHYGYGDCFLQTAMDWLKANGHVPSNAKYGTLYLRETLGGTYSVSDVAREKDL